MCKITNGLSLLHFHKIYLHLDFSNGLIFFLNLNFWYCIIVYVEFIMKSWFYQVTCWFLVSLDSNHSQTFSSANFVCLCVCVLLPYYISSRPSVVVVTTWSVCVSFFLTCFACDLFFFNRI